MNNLILQRYKEKLSRAFLVSQLCLLCILVSPITFSNTPSFFIDGDLNLKRPIILKINSVRQLQDIEYKETVGTKIYATFDVNYADHRECQVMVQFFNENGDNLKDANGLYKDDDDNVSVAKSFYLKNQFQTGFCMDFFIPYDELHLESGKHEIYFKIIINHDDQVISESALTKFKVSL